MEVRASLKPGNKGTIKYLIEYGDQLVQVRYRYDRARQKRITTVELIVDEKDWIRGFRFAPNQLAISGVKNKWGQITVVSNISEICDLTPFISNGRQANSLTTDSRFFVWPVYTGDVAVIPIPAAIWLFIFGLLGLFSVAKRRHI